MCGGHIAIEQCGRQIPHGDIVEAVAWLVVGQKRGCVDLEREQIAYGVLIFSAREPAERIGAAGIRCGGGGAIEIGGQLVNKCAVGRVVGSLLIERWHLSVIEFAHDLFPDRGMRCGISRVEIFKDQVAFSAGGIVAVVAILIKE